MTREAFVESAWGVELPALFRTFYNAAKQNQNAPVRDLPTFATGVFAKSKSIWNTVRTIFPSVSNPEEASVMMVRETHWGSPPQQQLRQTFDNTERGFQVTASTLVFCALRGG